MQIKDYSPEFVNVPVRVYSSRHEARLMRKRLKQSYTLYIIALMLVTFALASALDYWSIMHGLIR